VEHAVSLTRKNKRKQLLFTGLIQEKIAILARHTYNLKRIVNLLGASHLTRALKPA
jgi:hypothetical protein